MIVDIHGDRIAGRAAGRPTTAAAASLKDPATAVGHARRLMLDGTWRTVPKTGDDADKAVYTLRVHTPAALTVLPRAVVAALTRPVPLGGCSWCVARFYAAASFDPDPEPTPYAETYLGSMCGRCRHRRLVAEAERDALADYQARAASGPPAATRPAGQPPAPTGVIWAAAAGPPPSVTAALQAAAGRRGPDQSSRDRGDATVTSRRPPDPPYYTPRARGRPAEARPPR